MASRIDVIIRNAACAVAAVQYNLLVRLLNYILVLMLIVSLTERLVSYSCKPSYIHVQFMETEKVCVPYVRDFRDFGRSNTRVARSKPVLGINMFASSSVLCYSE
jgi:hypothetical protein